MIKKVGFFTWKTLTLRDVLTLFFHITSIGGEKSRNIFLVFLHVQGTYDTHSTRTSWATSLRAHLLVLKVT